MRKKDSKNNDKSGEISWNEQAGWGFDERGAENMNNNKEDKNKCQIDGSRGKMGEVGFGKEFFAIFEENEAKDNDYEKRNYDKREIVKIVREQLGYIGEDIAKRNIIKNTTSRRSAGVMVNARTSEPANEKANGGPDNPNVKPNRRFGEMIAAYYGVYNHSNKKRQWSDGGGHTKYYANNKHIEDIDGCR